MAPITQTAYFKLKQNASLDKTNPDTVHHLSQLFSIIEKQPGFVRQYWGIEIEDSSMFVWSIDWDDLKHHLEFADSVIHAPIMEQLHALFDIQSAKPISFNTHFISDTVISREAPVTEINYFNLLQDVSQEHRSAFLRTVADVGKAAVSVGGGRGFARGWVDELMPNSRSITHEAIGYNIMLGWTTVDEHIAFTKTPEFAEIRKAMPALVIPVERLKNMRHVAFQKIIA